MADEPMSDEPMTDDEVMERINRAGLDPYGMLGGQDRLIARLNRLQAEADSLRAREAAAMAIVRAVADRGVYFTLQNGRRCYFCEAETETYTGEPPHTPDCPVTNARALLAEE